jgi:NAD(P)-dependent dehydrogenase (short-subunit alcohol dehydrogenase family)
LLGKNCPPFASTPSSWTGCAAHASLKIPEDELEEHYRKRSLLQRSVYPEDIAEAAYFFASDLSEKWTGNFLNVDAGNAASFTRQPCSGYFCFTPAGRVY